MTCHRQGAKRRGLLTSKPVSELQTLEVTRASFPQTGGRRGVQPVQAQRGAGFEAGTYVTRTLGTQMHRRESHVLKAVVSMWIVRGSLFPPSFIFPSFNYFFTVNTLYLNDLGGKLQFVRGKFGGWGAIDSPALREATVLGFSSTQLWPATQAVSQILPTPRSSLIREAAPPSPSDDPPGSWLTVFSRIYNRKV